MKVLVVEDDDRVMAALCSRLGRHGFDIIGARTGGGALDRIRENPAVVLLDLGLPDRDGLEVCEQIRSRSQVPIIVTTARADIRSRVQGLNLGADGYLVKPFHLAELVARINAVSRRAATVTPAATAVTPAAAVTPVATVTPATGPVATAAPAPADVKPGRVRADGPAGDPPGQVVRVGRFRIDRADHTVATAGRTVTLSRREFELLDLLAGHPGQVLPHEMILRALWHTASPEARRNLHVLIAALRHKLAVPGAVQSVHGVGYRLAGG